MYLIIVYIKTTLVAVCQAMYSYTAERILDEIDIKFCENTRTHMQTCGYNIVKGDRSKKVEAAPVDYFELRTVLE